MCELGEGDDDANIENDFLVWKKIFSQEVCKGVKSIRIGSFYINFGQHLSCRRLRSYSISL